MPVNPLDYFEIGQRVGKAKRSTFGRVAEGVMGDFQAERDRKLKQSTELDTYRKKKQIDVQTGIGATGVYSFNPLTNQLSNVSSVPKGSIVRNTLSEDDLTKKAMIGQQASAIGEQMKSGGKLGTAVKRLNVISKQFNQALPASSNPLVQRVKGPLSVAGARTGIAPNPELMAIKKMSRPVGIQLVRAFGEVGNLSESDMNSATDVVSQEGLTEKERFAVIKQFAEFALAGASPESFEFMKRDPEVFKMIESLGLDIGSEGSGTSSGGGMESDRQQIQQAIASGEYAPDVIESMRRDFEAEYGQTL